MLDITTAPNRYTRKSANLADAFTFAQHFETGEWVTLAAGNVVSRITGSAEITHLVDLPGHDGLGSRRRQVLAHADAGAGRLRVRDKELRCHADDRYRHRAGGRG